MTLRVTPATVARVAASAVARHDGQWPTADAAAKEASKQMLGTAPFAAKMAVPPTTTTPIPLTLPLKLLLYPLPQVIIDDAKLWLLHAHPFMLRAGPRHASAVRRLDELFAVPDNLADVARIAQDRVDSVWVPACYPASTRSRWLNTLSRQLANDAVIAVTLISQFEDEGHHCFAG